MTLPVLDRGTVLFIPRQGVFTIDAVSQQHINNQVYEVCDLQHVFSQKTSRQARSGLERSNARVPTSHQVACDVVARLRHPSRKQIRGPWHQQKSLLEEKLKIGTLEKGVEVLRMIHRIDQDRWKTARTLFYQHVLGMVAEELAYIFDESPEAARRSVVTTLNNMTLEHT